MLFLIPPFISEPALANDSDKSDINNKWHRLWSTPDQQGQKAYQAQDYEKAADKFANKNWKASAYYRAGEFAKAAEHYEPLLDADSLYNKANALANLQKFQDAIKTYDEALKINPQLDDAIKNRDYLKQLLAQQEQQQSSQNSDQQQQDKSDKQSQGQDQQQANATENGSQSNDSESSQSEESNNGTEDSDANTKSSEKDTAQSNEPKESEATDSNAPKPGEQAEFDKPKEIKPPANEQTAEQMDRSQQLEENNQKDSKGNEANDVLSQLNQEQQQSLKQWLQRIPDNPGNLLRIKFRNNSLLKQRQQEAAQYKGKPW